MNQTLAVKAAPSFQESQPSLLPLETASRAVLHESDRLTSASIKGDLAIMVSEQEVARGPIIGHYTVETQDMSEPLFVFWHAPDGKPLNHCARSTAIAFDLCGTRAGHMWTTVITVQVTETQTCDTIVASTFVQIRVTNDPR